MHYPALGLIKGTVENISLDGLFVRMESVTLPVDAVLELSFKLQYNGSVMRHRLQGTIVHDYAHGFGVVFNKMKMAAESRLSLRLFLYS